MTNSILDFVSRIILVHPLQHNSIVNLMLMLGKSHLIAYDPKTNTIDLIKTVSKAIIEDNMILRDNATFGFHLDFDPYTNSFIDRPHIHWWWNGLFQANSGGDWEHSFFAFLEPLASMEKVMGCAYYDTMTMGPHQLTKDSCIVVPKDTVASLKERLKDYPGKILGFYPAQETLRSAINRIMEENYPQAYKLIDKEGHNLNQRALSRGNRDFIDSLVKETAYDCGAGYFKQVSLQIDESQPILLIQGENELLMPEYRDYAQGKFVGLHSHSPTDVEHNNLIKLLKEISGSPAKIHQYKAHFINDATDPNALCTIEVFKEAGFSSEEEESQTSSKTPEKSCFEGITMMLLGGVIAVAGIVTVALTFTILSTPGLHIALGLGAGGTLIGLGFFAYEHRTRIEESLLRLSI